MRQSFIILHISFIREGGLGGELGEEASLNKGICRYTSLHQQQYTGQTVNKVWSRDVSGTLELLKCAGASLDTEPVWQGETEESLV